MLEVVLPLPLGAMTYLPPHGQESRLGARVVVPWRGELRIGMVIGVQPHPTHTLHLRQAVAYLDPVHHPWWRPEEITFLQQAAQQTFCPPGSLLNDLAPYLEGPLQHRIRLVPGTPPQVLPTGMETLTSWQEARGFDPKLVDLLREGGVLEEEVALPGRGQKVLAPLRSADTSLSSRGQTALEALHQAGQVDSMAALARLAGVGTAVVKGLVERGWIGWREEEPPVELSQGTSLEVLPLPQVPPRLSGGRWDERLRLLAGLLAEGPCLVLFPEVALLQRWLTHFPGVLPFHGELSPAVRRQSVQHLLEGFSGSVFSTYQGLLLPFTPQRMVVVEDGSDAYKLSGGSRAHIVRLAELRAQQLDIPLTFLSQVPTPEAMQRPGHHFPLPAPRLHLINLNEARGWPLTGEAVNLLQQVVEKQRQAVILAGRRGYSAVLRCKNDNWKAMCPNCALPLRFHRLGRGGQLSCHQCGHLEKAPDLCPICGSEVFEPRGPGLEWLDEALGNQFPQLPRYRFSTEGRDNLEPLLAGQPGVLLGTTALLRAPVLPNLALVLLPYADGFRLLSDFRAGERFHRLLWQLAELHPRRRPLVVLQTFEPNDPLYRFFVAADPQGFAVSELKMREVLSYPPFSRLLKLEISHAREPQARDAAQLVAQVLRPLATPDELLGPVAAPVPRLRGQYVFHLLLKTTPQRLAALVGALPPARGFRLRLDPDPIGFSGLLED